MKLTYKYMRQVQDQCRDAIHRMDEQREKIAAEGGQAPTEYTMKAELMYDLFTVHEQIIEQLMDENRRLKRELKDAAKP